MKFKRKKYKDSMLGIGMIIVLFAGCAMVLGDDDSQSEQKAEIEEQEELAYKEQVEREAPAQKEQAERDAQIKKEQEVQAQAERDEQARKAQEAQAQQQVVPEKEGFANCTELRKVYPDGVPLDHPAYSPEMDRDKDGHACESSG